MQKVSQLQQIKSLYVIQRYNVTNLRNNVIIVRNRIPNIIKKKKMLYMYIKTAILQFLNQCIFCHPHLCAIIICSLTHTRHNIFVYLLIFHELANTSSRTACHHMLVWKSNTKTVKTSRKDISLNRATCAVRPWKTNANIVFTVLQKYSTLCPLGAT